MTRINVLQTNFTSGELDPSLFGRTDLRAYEDGAARLENVIVETTGGVRRRPGMSYIATAPGRGRLVTFEPGSGNAYLLIFSDIRIDIFRGQTPLATLSAPWSETEIQQISWAQFGESILIAHPDHPPQQITKISDVSWTIADLQFAEKENQETCEPFARFAQSEITLAASATTGSVTLTTSADFFLPEHLGVIVRLRGDQIRITNIVSTTQATGLVLGSLADESETTDWDEQAFSEARGWPIAISFHQNRMVVGGSRDLPNGLWLSRTGRLLDFDLGTGLDDEGIAFRLAANDAPTIRAIVSGRHVQIFTSIGEWIVTGDPLTPTNIQVHQQSRIGSPVDRQVPPRDVDGATLFAARNGREIREFLFTDTEQAYQAPDLALLARHLVADPVDQAFDRGRRLFLIVMADGSLVSIGIYRNANIVAWSGHKTDGSILSVAVTETQTFLLIERTNGVFVEELDDNLFVDAGLTLSQPSPTLAWSGLDHLEGQTVAVIADNKIVEETLVTSGQIVLTKPATDLIVGLSYTHVIEPLPPTVSTSLGKTQEPLYRPIRIVLRIFQTSGIRIDTGSGLRDLTFVDAGGGLLDPEDTPFTGDQTLRALGWRRGLTRPPWRIEQATPLRFTLLSATTEIKVNS